MTMNLPWRSTDFTSWPRTRLRSTGYFWRTTWCERNCASTMRRPGSLGASERTTVSTSGSSGTASLRPNLWIDQNIVSVGFHRVAIQLDGGIEIVFASAAVVGPFVPGTNHHVVLQVSLPDGSTGVRTDTSQRMQLA